MRPLCCASSRAATPIYQPRPARPPLPSLVSLAWCWEQGLSGTRRFSCLTGVRSQVTLAVRGHSWANARGRVAPFATDAGFFHPVWHRNSEEDHMRRLTRFGAVAALAVAAVVAFGTPSRAAGVQAGSLSCNVSSG